MGLGDITPKPWGGERLLEMNEHYALKLIRVIPGRRLSLQYHREKIETLYVIAGTGYLVFPESDTVYLRPGVTVHVPAGTKHRIVAGDGGELLIIEASTPQLDDVVRLEDDYGRVT